MLVPDLLDMVVTIPTAKVWSLNVCTAASIVMYERFERCLYDSE